MKVLVALSLFVISNAEVLQNPHSTPAEWDPEKITEVAITMRQAPFGGGIDIRVNIHNGYKHCSIDFGTLKSKQIAIKNGSEVQARCSSLELDESSNPTVQVLSGNSVNTFNVLNVLITTEHNAVFHAMFPAVYHRSRSGKEPAHVFFPSSTFQINSQVDCTGLTREADFQTMGQTCASNRMRVKSINARKHNYFCGPGCMRVKNLRIDETNNGFRCFESPTLQDNPQYCCMDGQRGGIPACE